MKNSTFTFVLSFLLMTFSLAAQKQRSCGAEKILKKQLTNDPKMLQIREAFEKRILTNPEQFVQSKSHITIPVVFNVLWNSAVENVSDAQIQSQLDVLNADFQLLNSDVGSVPSVFASLIADCHISFCLAKRDPTGLPTTGIRRKQTTKTTFDFDADDVKFDNTGGLDIWDRD